MRFLVNLITLAVILTACGESNTAVEQTDITFTACEDLEALGSDWYDSSHAQGDYLTLRADCSGASTYCGYVFEFTRPDGAGNTTITISSSNRAGGCMSPGVHLCTAILPDSNTLELDCGIDGSWSYTR